MAAHIAIEKKNNTRAVDVARLQSMLHAQRQATIYTSDVERDSPYFTAVQWAGLRGLLSDVVDYETAVYVPLKSRFGTQYSFAHSLHFVEPEKALDNALKGRWKLRLPCAASVEAATRGEFLREAMSACTPTR